MNKKKILFVLHLPPPVHGSSVVGSYVYNSKVVNESFETKYINLSTSHTVDEIGKKPFKKLIRYFKIIWQTVTQIITFKPDLFYIAIAAKGAAFYKDALLVFIAKMFGQKIVFHFHNKGVNLKQNSSINNFFYKKTFENTKAILLSKYLYYDIKKYFSKDSVYYCPNGIPERSVESNNENNDNKNVPVQILFLSNLIRSKGIFVLLAALKGLKEKELSFKCTIVGGEGDVSAEQLTQRIREFDLIKQIDYLGKKYGEEKEQIFHQSDIFVFPTYYETFGLVNLEAMQFSLPIISTFEGGIQDVVEEGKTGFLVPQKNSQALAEKIEALINNPELRKKMGMAGRKKYEENFTLEIFEKKLNSIFEEIISENIFFID